MSDVVLRASCSHDVAELVTVVLFEWGATAVGEHDAGETAVLEAGFGSTTDARAAAAAIDAWATDIHIGTVEPTWIEEQRDAIRPTRAGRWTVLAPWHDLDGAGADSVVIDPGPAFGHGGHPTTRLALDLLDSIVEPRTRALDLGCGSGVLAIAMGRAGATVDAVEIDAEAADIARLNVVRNELGGEVRVHHAEASSWTGGPYDVAAVNVTIDVHRRVVGVLSDVTTVVATGLLDHQVDELLHLHRTRIVTSRRVLDGWVGLVLSGRSTEH